MVIGNRGAWAYTSAGQFKKNTISVYQNPDQGAYEIFYVGPEVTAKLLQIKPNLEGTLLFLPKIIHFC